MKRIWSGGLRPRHAVVLLAVAVGIVLISLMAYGLHREHSVAVDAARSKTQNLVRVLEEHARQTLRRVDLGIGRAADVLEGAGDLVGGNPAGLRQRLRAQLPADGLISLFLLLDRNGAVVLSTLTENVGVQATVADREYFVAHRERAGLGTLVGAPVKGRVSGTWTLPVSARLDAPGGAFRGVLVAFVAPDHFQSFYESIDSGTNGFVTLFQRQGWIVARHPFDEGVLSRNWADSPMFRVHLPVSEAGTVRQVVAADGVERIYSYRALKEYPVIVSLGVSLTDSLAPWRASAWYDGILLLLALAALAGAAQALTWQLRRREAAETALRESEARFRSLSQLSSDWIWETDEEHRFVHTPAPLTAITGLTASSYVGKRRWEVPGLSAESGSWDAHREALERREAFRDLALTQVNSDGDRSHLLLSGEPVWGEEGAFHGYRGVGTNVTERRRAEEEVRRLNKRLERRVAERTAEMEFANRELETFTLSVSHDLRAPLRGIDGFTRMVLEGHGEQLSPDGRRQLGVVREQTRKMADLIDHLLELARVSQRELNLRPVNFGDLVRNCLSELAAELEGRQVEIVVGELPVWNADPALIKLLYLNLLANALKYTRKCEAARIEVGAEYRGAEQVVFVRDNGKGFDMVHAGKLFNAFQRLHRQDEYPGAGIGLAIVRRVAERHGARAWAEGATGKGATFYVAFPGTAATY